MVTISLFSRSIFPHPLPVALPNSHSSTIQEKLEELKLLLGRFSFPEDEHKILEWANIRLRQGDEQSLNNKLEQLRWIGKAGCLSRRFLDRCVA